jgi:putative Ca2+/H+ antiporter (TMEM165/GDT1 family)
MNLGIVLSTFAVIAIAELPDKTMIANIIMGSRGSAGWVWAGSALAFLVHVVIAVAAGRALLLLPHRVVEIVVTVAFGIGAAYLLFVPEKSQEVAGQKEALKEADVPLQNARRILLSAFLVVIVGEFGDLTQLLTANLAARSHASLSVGVGAVLGLWLVSAIGAFGGKSLLKVIPLEWIRRGGGLVLVGFCVAGIVGLA